MALDMMTAAALAGSIGGVLSIGSLFPQAYRIVQRRSAADVSLSTYLIALVASLLWAFYGYAHAAREIIVANAIIAFLAAFIAALKVFYDRKHPRPRS